MGQSFSPSPSNSPMIPERAPTPEYLREIDRIRQVSSMSETLARSIEIALEHLDTDSESIAVFRDLRTHLDRLVPVLVEYASELGKKDLHTFSMGVFDLTSAVRSLQQEIHQALHDERSRRGSPVEAFAGVPAALRGFRERIIGLEAASEQQEVPAARPGLSSMVLLGGAALSGLAVGLLMNRGGSTSES